MHLSANIVNRPHPFFPQSTGQRRVFAANGTGDSLSQSLVALIGVGLMWCMYWILTMQAELTPRVANARAIATEQSLDTSAPKTRAKHGSNVKPTTINVPRDEWNALKKRISDIEAWCDRNKHVLAVSQPRAEWETAEAESMLDATAAAAKLSLSSANQIRQRARDGKLFGVIAPGRERGMLFPAWQFHRSVIGEPLQQALSALHAQNVQGWAVHEFFEEPRVTLEGLSARQTLTAMADSEGYAPSALRLLVATPQERLARVLASIEEYSNES